MRVLEVQPGLKPEIVRVDGGERPVAARAGRQDDVRLVRANLGERVFRGLAHGIHLADVVEGVAAASVLFEHRVVDAQLVEQVGRGLADRLDLAGRLAAGEVEDFDLPRCGRTCRAPGRAEDAVVLEGVVAHRALALGHAAGFDEVRAQGAPDLEQRHADRAVHAAAAAEGTLGQVLEEHLVDVGLALEDGLGHVDAAAGVLGVVAFGVRVGGADPVHAFPIPHAAETAAAAVEDFLTQCFKAWTPGAGRRARRGCAACRHSDLPVLHPET